MTKYSVKLFGKFSVERSGQLVEGIQARKVQELLSYLLIFRNHPQPREVICEALWGDRSPLKARKCLRQALWHLQMALKDSGNSRKSKVLADADWVGIDPLADFRVDVYEFEQIVTSFKNTNAQDLSPSDSSSLESAAKLYQGDLLEGWYQDWCLFERERFKIMYLTLLDKLVQYCEIHGQYSTGLVYGTEILRQDHAYERAHRQMMRLYFLAGDRTQALHQYQRCVAALRTELDIEPSEATRELYEQIRSDTAGAGLPSGELVHRDAVEHNRVLSLMLKRLDVFSDELGKIRIQIEKEVAALGDA